MKKVYVLKYFGMWLGGSAVILATSVSETKKLLLKDKGTIPKPKTGGNNYERISRRSSGIFQ